MTWQPVRPIDHRSGLLLPPTPYAVRSACGRFQIAKVLGPDGPSYLLYDVSSSPARLVDVPAFDSAGQAKRHAEGLA